MLLQEHILDVAIIVLQTSDDILKSFSVLRGKVLLGCSLMRYRHFFNALYEQPISALPRLINKYTNPMSATAFLQRYMEMLFSSCDDLILQRLILRVVCLIDLLVQRFGLRQFFLIAKINSPQQSG